MKAIRDQRDKPGWLFGLLALAGVWATSVLAQQQAPSSVLGGFSRDNGPINIQADALTINDQKKTAIYRGNVVAVQGDNTLRTVELEVQYTSREEEQKGAKGAATKGTAKPAKAATSTPGDESQQIKRIKAKEKVVMVSTPAGTVLALIGTLSGLTSTLSAVLCMMVVGETPAPGTMVAGGLHITVAVGTAAAVSGGAPQGWVSKISMPSVVVPQLPVFHRPSGSRCSQSMFTVVGPSNMPRRERSRSFSNAKPT